MLDHVELMELEEALKDELCNNLIGILTKLNSTGRLEEFLGFLNLEHLLDRNTGYRVSRSGKIVVIGASEVREEQLLGIGKNLGLKKDRFEFHLNYEEGKKFDFRKMQWRESYSVVLVGQMPHSGISKGEYGSVISAIENEPGYPPVKRLGTSGLKITKSDFRTKLGELIASGLLEADDN